MQLIVLSGKFLKASGCLTGALALGLAVTPSALGASFADFVFVVDESGSMYGEHSWLRSVVGDLDASLQAKGLGIGSESNRYGLVGFGNGYGGNLGRTVSVGGDLFGNASQLATATNFLTTSGWFEDGYSAIDYALNNYSFRNGAAVNFVLITDEDRDIGDRSLNFNSILSGLQAKNALLNVVVNSQMTGSNRQRAIGADAHGNVFMADGRGGFTTNSGGVSNSSYYSYYGYDTTKADYVDLAWATGNSTISGAAWDLNMLRAGGNTAKSFSAAFAEIKATEALKQKPHQVPEPASTLGLAIIGLVGTGSMLKRKR